MLFGELADRLSFVRGEIVEDDVNLLPRRAQGYDLLQKKPLSPVIGERAAPVGTCFSRRRLLWWVPGC